uniref:Uncharacterized protein n=1 Tax=Anguilla anguilla TaxID=7936 RepID=A0A0E9SMV8_ANGAN
MKLSHNNAWCSTGYSNSRDVLSRHPHQRRYS